VFIAEELEVWNLTSGGTAYIEAQTIFNVVGKLKRHVNGIKLAYALNGGQEQRVPLGQSQRNIGPGHFNIDTIRCSDLKDENTLDLIIIDGTARTRRTIPFLTKRLQSNLPEYSVDFDGVTSPEEIGQVIDGHWRVARDDEGTPCLEMRQEDAGYDRLFGIGRHDWTTGYRVDMHFSIRDWTDWKYFNVGIIFKWNAHLCGEGKFLPTQWSTGLAYYATKCPGMRLRFGVNVHNDASGRKIGSHVLQEKSISPLKRWCGLFWNHLLRIGKQPIAQLKRNVHYQFCLIANPNYLALDVFEEGNPNALVQLHVPDPPDFLREGCVGIIACNCAVRVYKFSVSSA